MIDNTSNKVTVHSGETQVFRLVAARVESNIPIAYRLIRRGDGNGNMLPVLQGMFTWTQGKDFGREWRDLETQDEPYVEDHIPFG